MGKYRFDRETLKFVEDKIGLKGWVRRLLKYFVVSILLAILYYFVISVIYNTKQERQINRENNILSEELSNLSEKLNLLETTMENLREKDREIYMELFNSAPSDIGNAQGLYVRHRFQ